VIRTPPQSSGSTTAAATNLPGAFTSGVNLARDHFPGRDVEGSPMLRSLGYELRARSFSLYAELASPRHGRVNQVGRNPRRRGDIDVTISRHDLTLVLRNDISLRQQGFCCCPATTFSRRVGRLWL
jgi:hypothetical protein